VTEEAITRATFGGSYNDGRVVFGMQSQLMAFASEAFRKVLVPGYRFMPTKKNWLSWKLDRGIRRNLTKLIGRRSEEAAAVEAAEGEKADTGSFRDLLGLMINASQRTTRAKAIPVHDMVEECKTFFFAGKQTTTNLLTWATVLLAMHPEWQERARREVLDVCGSDDPSKEHLPRLKTVRPLTALPPRFRFVSICRRNFKPAAGRRAFRSFHSSADTHSACSMCFVTTAGHDHKRDAPAVPAGGGDDPARQGRRAAVGRVHDPARHGAAHPDHGHPPRRAVLGPGRGAVQPGAVRRRGGQGGEAPAGLHTLRARVPDVRGPEPGAPGGQAHHGHPPAAVRDPGVPQLRARADGADAPLPAVRGAVDLPPAGIAAVGGFHDVLLSSQPPVPLSKLTEQEDVSTRLEKKGRAGRGVGHRGWTWSPSNENHRTSPR
uniref:Cytochrome P450 n=1 Tax=Aegilops tauschii subsp. strangulata TaxID=200361 RepID=A0A453NQP8_AEGTS